MFETQNYAVLFPMCIFLIIDAMLVVNSVRQGFSTVSEKTFFSFICSVTTLQLCSTISYSNDLQLIEMGVVPQFIFCSMGVVFLSLTGYWWMIYILQTNPALAWWTARKRKIILCSPVFLLIVMVLCSPWTHWIFYIDDNGVFCNGTLMQFQLLSYLYFLFALVLSLSKIRDGGDSALLFQRFSYYMIPGLLGGLANLFVFRGGYSQIGCSVGAILMYMEQYLAEVNENKRLRSIDAINRQLVQANEEIQAARDAAFEASQAKTEFLFNMSHDIRTPMNAVLGYLDIALKHYDDKDKTLQCLKKAMHSGNHLLSLINDILEMSRIESRQMQITETPLDTRKEIEGMGNMVESLAANKNIDIKVQVGDIQNPYIYADALHINEVLLNLLSNAVKYTPDGGEVLYLVRQISEVTDGKVTYEFVVSDTGIGMSEEFQTHMFESFSRENNTTVSKIEGTGLGLSIVKSIVESVGGTISVRSKLQEGTTMIVRIPFRVMEEEAIRQFTAAADDTGDTPDACSLEDKRILYVEDNALNREIGEELLEEVGILVETAEDGSVAVERINEKGIHFYDAILMDIQMPVMNGYEATTAIRAMEGGADIPIIALSANAFAEDIQKSLAVGMNAHVAKPIQPETLVRVLRSMIR